MNGSPQARPGMTIAEIDTPALIIDLEALDKNIAIMAGHCRQHKINLRPHAKTHKSVDIARLQMKSGAVGVCCQKVSEAESLAAGGITDILVTNQIVGPAKTRRLARLAGSARISVCADHPDNIDELSRCPVADGGCLTVLVEVDVGGGRCGVKTPDQALLLARKIADAPTLRFGGIQAYCGKAQHVRDFGQRRALIEEGVGSLKTLLAGLADLGIECPSVTGAGTGSFPFETASGVYTELQCGSYIFMDADYAGITVADGSPISTFAHSLFVLTAVMSKTSADYAVCDAGLKAHSIDSGLPRVYDRPGISYTSAADEHGTLTDPDNQLRLGDKLLLIPGHCDPTVNLHDHFVGVRRGVVEEIWPVSARGMVF